MHFALLLSAFRLLLLPVFRQFSLHFCARFDYFIAIFCAHLHPPLPLPSLHTRMETNFILKLKLFGRTGKTENRKAAMAIAFLILFSNWLINWPTKLSNYINEWTNIQRDRQIDRRTDEGYRWGVSFRQKSINSLELTRIFAWHFN